MQYKSLPHSLPNIMKNKLLFSYLFLCFWPLNIYASIDFISKKITLNDGLCNNNVKHIYQDTKGFIWISTLNGLSRYDGTSFITLKPDENDLHSIKDHRIDHIIEDNNGLIWIYSPSENFCCYNLRKEKYMNFYGNEYLNQKYSKIYIASNGEIWLWHNRNGCRKIIYNGTDLSSTAYKKEFNTLSSNNVLTVKEGLQGNIWIGTTAGLNLMNNDDSNIFMKEKSFENIVVYNNKEYFISKDNLIYSYSSESESLVLITKIPFGNLSITSSFNNNELWYIFSNIGMITYNIENDTFDANINYELKNGTYKTDNKNNHWIYNHSGNIWNIDSDNKILKLNLIPSNKLGFIDFERYNIYEDSRGLIWFSTYGNGAFIYDRNNNSVQHIKSNIDGTGLIDSDYLLCLFEDRQGGIWISSEYVGLSRLTVINEGTERILPNLKHLTDRSNTIRMVKQTGENEIWVATRNGELYCYDKDLNQKYSKQVFDYNIYSISIDPDGNKWIGSRGNGVLINNQWYKHDNKDTTSISENNIFSIYHDKKNRTWLGLFGGGLSLAYKENNRYKFRSFLNNNYNQKQLRVIEEDGNNNMWIGTNDGLFIINPDSIIENPENYQVLCVENHKLKSNEIKSLYYDKKGHMYISTSGEGFAICNINNSEIKYFNSKNGLLNDIILSINEDNNGNIWLATEYGISKFKPGSESFENFIFSSNSLANVYTENSSCRLKDGRILFGTNNGLMILHPEKLNYNSSSSKAAFTNLKVNGIDMKTSDLYFPIKESIT